MFIFVMASSDCYFSIHNKGIMKGIIVIKLISKFVPEFFIQNSYHALCVIKSIAVVVYKKNPNHYLLGLKIASTQTFIPEMTGFSGWCKNAL